jgi:hypothetical protein
VCARSFALFALDSRLRYRDFEHFESRFNFSSRDALNFSVSNAVFFMNEEKTATATVRSVFEKIKAVDKVKCAVFVIRKMMVPQARKALTEGMRECRTPISVDVFTESELVVNVMKHELVPEHKILSPAEKRELLRKYHVTEAQLPRILVTGLLFCLNPLAMRLCLRYCRSCVQVHRVKKGASGAHHSRFSNCGALRDLPHMHVKRITDSFTR